MKTTIAIIIKFFVTLGAAWLSFMVFGMMTIWTALIIAAVGTAVNYLVGDLVLLPRYGNTAASILDGVMAGVLAWVVLLFIPGADYVLSTGLIFAVTVTITEFFFHMYLIKAHVVEARQSDMDLPRKGKLRYNTETGSELNPFFDKEGFDKSVDSSYNLGPRQSGDGSPDRSDSSGKNRER